MSMFVWQTRCQCLSDIEFEHGSPDAEDDSDMYMKPRALNFNARNIDTMQGLPSLNVMQEIITYNKK